MRLHGGAQHRIDARPVAFTLLLVPSEHVRIQPYGDHLFPGGQDHLGIFPEVFIRGVCVGVGVDRNFKRMFPPRYL